ncbi:hypothetical protein ILUMI_03257 [Ignelater luminosus]|uniref:Uncharacterized protein n=1 Tax=Ignelater luminosus TaxID=2038154 RepID=A0A8K0DGM5_IGNLU|nr:hypothetical protein ILUMI_03257 [Ignelater luminosus]
MDLLFIIFIAVVVIGFTIILCVGCYCSCCHPLSYSSSSSHYSERRHGEYKASATSKTSNTLEYDQHHWNSAATLPLITPPEHHSTSSLSSYPNKQPPPVGFEQMAKSQTESNQTISSSGFHSYGDNASARPPYPTNQEVVSRTSQYTTSVNSYSPQPNTPIYPNNNQIHSSNLEANTVSYSQPVTLHSPYPPGSMVSKETTYYTKTASPQPPHSTNTIGSYPVNSNKTTYITTVTDSQQRPNSYNTISHPPANSNKITYISTTKDVHPVSNRPDYTVETVDFHPSTTTTVVVSNDNNKQYPKPPQPMQSSSSTTTTTYTAETTIPSNFNTMPANRNFYYNLKAPPANIETVNESHKSRRIITKHPSTGSLYDNM